MSLKRNIKVLSLALVAVFAFSAMAAVSAQAAAPRWTVGAATLVAGAEKSLTGSSTGTVELKAAGLGITLRSTTNGDCTAAGNIVGSAASSPGTNKSIILTCKNVEVVGAEATCQAHSVGAANGTVVTGKLKSTLVWLAASGNETGDTFAPESGETFTTIEITGGSCPVSGSFKVTGNVIAQVNPVKEDVKVGTLTYPATAIKSYFTNQTPTRTKDEDTGLKMGASTAIFSGVFDASLTTGETFGVEPG